MQIGDFFCGKRVFLTGHTGFKGAWLCHVLHYFGADVTGFALVPEAKSFFNSCRTDKIIRHNLGDINDYKNLKNILCDSNPDIVIHMAAQPLVRLSYEIPLETFQTNIIGTANVLMAAHACENQPLVAIITSDKCYENMETDTPYKENDRMGGYDPYSASKGAAEIVTASLFKSFHKDSGQSVLSLRGGNVIGGGDWALDRIMTDMIEALVDERAPIIRSPKAIRPWQHILDVLSGYLSAIMYLSGRSPGSFDQFNIGPLSQNEADVEKLANCICKYWGSGIKPDLSSVQADLHEAKLLKLDISKALEKLEWAPKYGFDETVKQTVGWYKAEREGEDMTAFSMKQIKNYFVRAKIYG